MRRDGWLGRRVLVGTLLVWVLSGALTNKNIFAEEPPEYRLATFSVEVTAPIGHPLMAGGVAPAARVVDPLFARGFILLGAGKPVVLAAVDWCEIRNDAYARWRAALAQAAETTPDRVLVTCLHQHDAPIADLQAEMLLKKHKAVGSVCDLAFHEKTVVRVAAAVAKARRTTRRVTHLGMGQAKVEQVASNRRFLAGDGRVVFSRTSASRDPRAQEQPEGIIDPWLKTLSFWDGDQPVLALSCYATHPMSYYGKGGVSADFVGMARKRRQADDPDVFQIYVSGCSGNVTAGKYNDGAPENRPILGERIYTAMKAAWKATRRVALTRIGFRSVPFVLKPRQGEGFSEKELLDRMTGDKRPFGQCLAGLGLSWRQRVEAGQKLDLPVLDLGEGILLLLPAEAYVEYQLKAQQLRPDAFVVTMGYGECGPGYIPTEKAMQEKDTNLRDWCWVAPGAETAMTQALEQALKK